ncbi:MAG: Ig-like domain-containing protein [Gemmatimonadetes bacterium]|nr:Ig-like domain-containing protein [Gemmatimonadota bacterium]
MRFAWAAGTIGIVIAGCSGGTGPDPGSTIEITTLRSVLVPAETVQLAWSVKGSDGSVGSSPSIAFTSSLPTVATVTAGGVVTAVAPGTVTITANVDGATGSIGLTVAEGGLVSAAGGTVTGFGGALELVVPAGAVSEATAIRIASATNPILDPTAVAGSVLAVGPEGLTLSAPATLRLTFDPARRPAGLPVADLRIRRFDGTAWQPLPGGFADANANRATASLTTLGTVSVGWVPPPAPCLAAEHRQFDFWIGAWTVSAGGQQIALSDITEAPGGCAILEHYRDGGGTVGRSISYFQPGTAMWYQTYVDNAGNRLVIAGTFENGAMTLLNPPGGGTQHERWRWTVEGVRVRQQATFTANGGASYSAPSFDGLYARR